MQELRARGFLKIVAVSLKFQNTTTWISYCTCTVEREAYLGGFQSWVDCGWPSHKILWMRLPHTKVLK